MEIIYQDSSNKIFWGNHFSYDLNSIISRHNLGKKKIILILGFPGFVKSKYFKQLNIVFSKNQINIKKSIIAYPNPKIAYISKFTSKLNKDFGLILTVGGGSAVDTGKLIKYELKSPAQIFTIYTLPGSATIVSPFAIFDNYEFKIGIHSEDLIPNYSYINSSIFNSIGLQRKIIAVSDIFAHAIESFYSLKSTESSRKNSKTAIRILLENDIKTLKSKDLLKADIHAGLAERVGIVLFPHAAGHYLTYKFNIAHGITTMYFLPFFLITLKNEGINVVSRYINYANNLFDMLKEQHLMPELVLSKDQVKDLFKLVKKYMGFVFENSPINMQEKDYNIFFERYVK